MELSIHEVTGIVASKYHFPPTNERAWAFDRIKLEISSGDGRFTINLFVTPELAQQEQITIEREADVRKTEAA